MNKQELIEKISNVLNDTGAYNKICEILKDKGVSGDDHVFVEWEGFLIDKVLEEFTEDIEFNCTGSVIETDEDGEPLREVDIELNVFAKDSEDAFEKAEANIREQNPKWEDCSIDIFEVNEV